MPVIRREGESLESYVARLEAENAELAAAKAAARVPKLRIKAGEKGTVVLTGTRAQWPVMSAYINEAEMAAEFFGVDPKSEQFANSTIGKFIAENRAILRTQEEKKAAKAAA